MGIFASNRRVLNDSADAKPDVLAQSGETEALPPHFNTQLAPVLVVQCSSNAPFEIIQLLYRKVWLATYPTGSRIGLFLDHR
ncbi:uncharacterized protein APUU_21759S [Aspergillus puulaauensis]|uniref:Uncharacterized protein n=1 Tax=Aspergillus puulaauensis TaxID=1220207 RepID=A0A7R8AK59_9EURO|nr:uncharacterized protein APUU_21759S [Aspergillus puulaauensis]BCS21327.1 hypothetical protein APUU_21759S [Aspergillus puulaauensis]